MDEDALNLNDDDYLSVDEMMDQNEDDHGPDPVQDDFTSVMFFDQFPLQLCLLSRHSMFEAVLFASIWADFFRQCFLIFYLFLY